LACAQDYPDKPIRIVCSGATQELISRLIAQGITTPLGQPVIVQNRPNVPIASETVAKAKADGYTVLLAGSSFYVTPLTQKMPYDPIKDFTALTVVGRAPIVLYVSPSLPVKSLKELIAYAKARPGELNSSNGGIGGGSHISLEQLNALAGIKIVPVPYTSGSQEVADLISGRIQMTFAPASPLMEQVKLGKVRALAVTSRVPSALAPDLPTLDSTLPGYEWSNMTTMSAPATTPKAIVDRLNREILRVLGSAEIKDRMLTAGMEIAGTTPEQSATLLAAETAKANKLIKAIGLELK
jgi:tripartite-type tricarboxylate transporter receptor subunit TctC